MKLMSKIDRISAIILTICFLLYILSGFDLQVRIFSINLSSLIHLKYLFLIAEPVFIFHTTYAFHLAMKRRKFWNLIGKTLLALYVAVNLGLYIMYFVIQS